MSPYPGLSTPESWSDPQTTPSQGQLLPLHPPLPHQLPFQPLHGHGQRFVQLLDHPAAGGVHGEGAGGGGEVRAETDVLQLVLDLGRQDRVVVLGPTLLATLLGGVGRQGEVWPPYRHADHDFLWR